MRSSWAWRYLAPGVAALACLILWNSVDAQERPDRIVACRHRGADGRGAEKIDLPAMERRYRAAAEQAREALGKIPQDLAGGKTGSAGYRSGLGGCSLGGGERTVALAERVPERFRPLVLYFVAAPRGGRRPGILPEPLPENAQVFVLAAESLEDVGRLAKSVGGRVTLATAEFAQAVGVTCANARVTFSADGRSAIIRETRP